MKFGVIMFVVAVVIGYNFYDDFDPEQLRGKNVVITGASAGIGEQLAYHYARLGARILITSRTEADLQKVNVIVRGLSGFTDNNAVTEHCKQEGGANGVYLYHVADMSDPQSAEQLIQVAQSRLGGIDFLVLNHIKVVPLQLWMATPENMTLLESVLNVNFLAYVRLASQALPILERSKGSIVAVSSVTGRVPQPYLVPYSTSKFAIDGFFTGLRQELQIRKINISVTICYIGLTDTSRGMEILREFGGDRIIKAVSPASPDDVAYAILRGGAMRQRAVYYPYTYVRPAFIVYNFVPEVIEYILKAIYSHE